MILSDIDAVVETFENKVYSFGTKNDANETALKVNNGQTMIFLDSGSFNQTYTVTGTPQFKDNQYRFRIILLSPKCSDNIDDDATGRRGVIEEMELKAREFVTKLKNKGWDISTTGGVAWKEFEGKMSGWYIDVTATKQFELYIIPC